MLLAKSSLLPQLLLLLAAFLLLLTPPFLLDLLRERALEFVARAVLRLDLARVRVLALAEIPARALRRRIRAPVPTSRMVPGLVVRAAETRVRGVPVRRVLLLLLLPAAVRGGGGGGVVETVVEIVSHLAEIRLDGARRVARGGASAGFTPRVVIRRGAIVARVAFFFFASRARFSRRVIRHLRLEFALVLRLFPPRGGGGGAILVLRPVGPARAAHRAGRTAPALAILARRRVLRAGGESRRGGFLGDVERVLIGVVHARVVVAQRDAVLIHAVESAVVHVLDDVAHADSLHVARARLLSLELFAARLLRHLLLELGGVLSLSLVFAVASLLVRVVDVAEAALRARTLLLVEHQPGGHGVLRHGTGSAVGVRVVVRARAERVRVRLALLLRGEVLVVLQLSLARQAFAGLVLGLGRGAPVGRVRGGDGAAGLGVHRGSTAAHGGAGGDPAAPAALREERLALREVHLDARNRAFGGSEGRPRGRGLGARTPVVRRGDAGREGDNAIRARRRRRVRATVCSWGSTLRARRCAEAAHFKSRHRSWSTALTDAASPVVEKIARLWVEAPRALTRAGGRRARVISPHARARSGVVARKPEHVRRPARLTVRRCSRLAHRRATVPRPFPRGGHPPPLMPRSRRPPFTLRPSRATTSRTCVTSSRSAR